MSHLTERLVDFEGILPALVWAAIIALTFGHLQKLGQDVAAQVLPIRTPPEDAARRLQLYEAALEGFRADGDITPREAAVLDHLRERLGLSETDVMAHGRTER